MSEANKSGSDTDATRLTRMIVRGWHFSFEVDGDAALGTLYYPGDSGRLDEARLTGQVPPLADGRPWPLVVVMPGINVAPDGYRWLAHRLVPEGLCVATYAAIGSLGPAGRGITPGLDLGALSPATIGTRCPATALGPLLDRLGGGAEADGAPAAGMLDRLAGGTGADGAPAAGMLDRLAGGTGADGVPAAGMLDFDRVVVGGHSAGGTVALHSSDPGWVPGLRAVFAYGAHTMVAAALGHGESTVVAIPAKVPVLLLAGTDDGVIAASRDRYGYDDGAHDPVRRTFEEGVVRNQGDSWLVELAGVGHFAVCDPVDTTSGRSFLEPEPEADPVLRGLIGDLIAAFIASCLVPRADACLRLLVGDQRVARWDRR